MGNGESTRPLPALRRLRQRWLAPSPPLAVDDEPHWHPAVDPEGDQPGHNGETERPAPAPARP